ncbi:nitroreductase [Bradyrhizobium sp. HKCCYLS20291]|uniref:nitroreductase n=1 Tax=Bradyrhizobium sp. HKCCYLS20291 TaxID=3420766 RepID=UPI003EBAFAF4
MTAPTAADSFFLRRGDILVGIVQERYSCRAFLPMDIPQQTIDAILLTAQRTASWQNTQPWNVAIASARATRRLRTLIRQYAKEHRKQPDPPTCLSGEYKKRAERFWDSRRKAQNLPSRTSDAVEPEELQFFDAPRLALVTTPGGLGHLSTLDCGGYIANFLLAAQAFGVATSILATLADFPDFWREQFALPSDQFILCGIAFGYEDSRHTANRQRTTRAPISQSVKWFDD